MNAGERPGFLVLWNMCQLSEKLLGKMMVKFIVDTAYFAQQTFLCKVRTPDHHKPPLTTATMLSSRMFLYAVGHKMMLHKYCP